MLPISRHEQVEVVPREYSAERREALERQLAETDDPERQKALRERIAQCDAPPTYVLRVPGPLDRIHYREALQTEGVEFPGEGAIHDALEAAIEALAPDDEKDELLEQLRAVQAVMDPEDEATSAGDTKALARFEDEVARRDWPAYRRLRAVRQTYVEIGAYYAMCRLLVGARNVATPFARVGDWASEEFVRGMPRSHIAAVAGRAWRLMELDPAVGKDSRSS